MSINEFFDKYNLHDSYVEKVSYDDTIQNLLLLVNFAFWLQDDYVDGDPENGELQVVFNNVSLYSCQDGDPCGDFVGILGSSLNEQGDYIISFSDDADVYFEMSIHAETVTVNIL